MNIIHLLVYKTFLRGGWGEKGEEGGEKKGREEQGEEEGRGEKREGEKEKDGERTVFKFYLANTNFSPTPPTSLSS